MAYHRALRRSTRGSCASSTPTARACGPADGRVVSNFLVQAIDGEPLTIYGDGKQTRSFCYVDDEVRGILALLDSDVVGPVNIGNPTSSRCSSSPSSCSRSPARRSEIVFEPLPVDDPTQRRPDITLARDAARLGADGRAARRSRRARTTWYLEERARGRA